MPIGKGCITESEQQRYGLKICENEHIFATLSDKGILIPKILLLSLMIHCNGSAAKTYNKALIGQPCLV
jgi:hypothetical protein